MEDWLRKFLGTKLKDEDKEVLRKCSALRGMIASHRQRIDQINAEAKKAVATHEAEIVQLRSRCPHPVTTYSPDPAGGSDSNTTCDVCGWTDAGSYRRS